MSQDVENRAGLAGIEAYRRVVEAANRVEDSLVDNAADTDVLTACAAMLEDVARRLESLARVDFSQDPLAKASADPRFGIRERGLVPDYTVTHESDVGLRATTVFRPHFEGLGAVHGGAIVLLFDDALGRMANHPPQMMARTAYLNVDFRQPVPVGVPLELELEVAGVEGRKRLVEGRLLSGDVVLSEARGLWVELQVPIA